MKTGYIAQILYEVDGEWTTVISETDIYSNKEDTIKALKTYSFEIAANILYIDGVKEGNPFIEIDGVKIDTSLDLDDLCDAYETDKNIKKFIDAVDKWIETGEETFDTCLLKHIKEVYIYD